MKRIPGLTMLLVCSGIVSQSQSTARAPEIKAHISRAEAALRANDQEVAGREFRAVLGLDPTNAEANTNLGLMEFARGDYMRQWGWNINQVLILVYLRPHLGATLAAT